MTAANQCFSTSYAEARDKFLKAANTLDGENKLFKNTETGPDKEPLYVDSCWIGPRDAEKVLLLISGTHGVEGFAGSACQLAWMDELSHHPLPNGVAALVVHIINPYGCAWLCVETEENIDLNRNFVDFQKPLPTNDYYEQLHSALSCSEYEGKHKEEAKLTIKQFIEANGYGAFLEAAAKGQYQHDDGFNFGGQQPAWSNKILAGLLQEALSHAKKVAVIDYHTGLGEYGDAILISDYLPDSETANRQQSWYGNIHFSQAGDIDYESTGGLAASIGKLISQAEVTPIVLEYGTYEIERIASAMLDSFWLTQFGDYSTDLSKQIQQEIKQCFYPNEPDWNNKILHHSNKVIMQTITGLETNY